MTIEEDAPVRDTWECRCCTLSNPKPAARCAACGARRPALAEPLSVAPGRFADLEHSADEEGENEDEVEEEGEADDQAMIVDDAVVAAAATLLKGKIEPLAGWSPIHEHSMHLVEGEKLWARDRAGLWAKARVMHVTLHHGGGAAVALTFIGFAKKFDETIRVGQGRLRPLDVGPPARGVPGKGPHAKTPHGKKIQGKPGATVLEGALIDPDMLVVAAQKDVSGLPKKRPPASSEGPKKRIAAEAEGGGAKPLAAEQDEPEPEAEAADGGLVDEAEGWRLHLSRISPTGYTGVSRKRDRFQARFRGHSLGVFDRAVEAAVAYARAAQEQEEREAAEEVQVVDGVQLSDKIGRAGEVRMDPEPRSEGDVTWMGKHLDVPASEFGQEGTDTYDGVVTKTSHYHVQIYFEDDGSSYWYKKAYAMPWRRDEVPDPNEKEKVYQASVVNKLGKPSQGTYASPVEEAAAIAQDIRCGQCERHTRCVRGFKHGGKGGRCSLRANTKAEVGGEAGEQEEIPDTTLCEVCGLAHSKAGDQMLLCDGLRCGRSYHQRCCTPPVAEVPEGSWLCSGCVAADNEVDPDALCAPPPSRQLDRSLVGRRVRVYWELDDLWYKGEVRSYSTATQLHLVVYDDGDRRGEPLNFEGLVKWELVDGGSEKEARKQLRPQGRPQARRKVGGVPHGARVEIQWGDGVWYEGAVADWCACSELHHVHYDDGEAKWHRLKDEETEGTLRWL